MAEEKSQRMENKGKEVFRDESTRFNLSTKFFQEPPRKGQDLAFVNLTASSGATQDSGKRRLVRSHVMHNIHQQRQMEEYDQWQEQRLILPKDSSFVVRERPLLDIAGIDEPTQEEEAEPEFGGVDEDLEWDPTMDSSNYPNFDISEVQGTWVSSVSIPADDPGMTIEDMTYVPGSSNFWNLAQHGGTHNQDDNTIGCLAQGEEPFSAIISTQLLECPSVSQNIIPLSSPSRGKIDPFETMPSLRNGRAQALMYHYTKVLVRSMISVAVDPEDKWFGYSLSDPALFHSTMLHSAAHNALLAGNTDLADPMSLKWDAMKLLNDKLGDPAQRVSDLTIGSAAALVLFENQSANVVFSNVHMNGLCKMVQLRGGLQNLGLAGILRRKILWADLCNSMFSHSIPRFGNFLSSTSEPKETKNSESTTAFEICQTYETQLREIFGSLKFLSCALSGPFSRTNIDVDDIYTLERRVVVLLAETNPAHLVDPNLQSDEHISKLREARTTYQIALAAMIYIYMFLRDNLVGVPIFSVLVSRLSNSVHTSRDEADLEGTWPSMANDNSYGNCDQKDVLFWVLVLGALAAKGREERNMFVPELRIVTNVLRVRSFVEFVVKLKRIAWIERRDDGRLWELWSEIYGLG